jgi:magnesium-transporting ATPase (P-type)
LVPGNDDDDVDPSDGRHESENERSDRNWNEMLQETRITQTGTQILSGFLLTIVFQPRFSSLSPFQHNLYLVLVIAATLTTALALTPVYLHRLLFRRHKKTTLVRYGHRLISCALAGLVVVMVGTVLLIFDVANGLNAGTIAAVVVLAAIVLLAGIPARRVLREHGNHVGSTGQRD